MGYKVEFLISGLPMTYNALNRKHFQFKTAEKNKWHAMVKAIVRNRKPPSPLEKYKLTLIRHSSSEPDYDGLVSTWKPIVDALIKSKVIADDKLSNSGQWNCKWKKCKRGGGCIEVIVEEV